MNKKILIGLLLSSINYLTSAFSIVSLPMLRTPTKISATSLRMTNHNVTDVNTIFGKLNTRRDLLAAAVATSLSAIKTEPVKASKADDLWTQHKGPFTEDLLKDFTKTSSGLLYKDISQGRGPSPNDGDAVTINMVGYIYESGEKWSNTYKGIPAYQSVVRAGARENQKFMKGLNEGVANMQRGAKRILVIPAYLAYNYVVIYSQNDPSQIIIPGGAALVCYVEVVDFKKLS